METKYPDIKVRLTGTNSHTFAFVGRVAAALHRNGVSQDEVKAFWDEALSGTYEQAIQTCMRWVKIS